MRATSFRWRTQCRATSGKMIWIVLFGSVICNILQCSGIIFAVLTMSQGCITAGHLDGVCIKQSSRPTWLLNSGLHAPAGCLPRLHTKEALVKLDVLLNSAFPQSTLGNLAGWAKRVLITASREVSHAQLAPRAENTHEVSEGPFVLLCAEVGLEHFLLRAIPACSLCGCTGTQDPCNIHCSASWHSEGLV